MIKYGRTDKFFRRKIGESRIDSSIYKNLGHPFEIKNHEVIFVGKEEQAYCLTKGKKYMILESATSGKHCWDSELWEKCKNMKDKNYDCGQTEDYFITIINDKGHKREYSHLMFKTIDGKPIKEDAD